MVSHDLQERLRRIRMVILDNDGVLTDGRIVLGDYGDELKFFDVQDGLGLTLLNRAGFVTAIISGKKSRINQRRAKETGITKLYQNATDKLKVYEKAIRQFGIKPDEVCYVGDDLLDVPVMNRVGFAVAVANATPEVKAVAHHVTEKSGGRGAVREVVDLILKVQGKWAEVTQRYFR